jgi:hypothetical protein
MVEWLEGDEDERPLEARVYCRHPRTTSGPPVACARHVGKAGAKYVSFPSLEATRVLAHAARRFPSRRPPTASMASTQAQDLGSGPI